MLRVFDIVVTPKELVNYEGTAANFTGTVGLLLSIFWGRGLGWSDRHEVW